MSKREGEDKTKRGRELESERERQRGAEGWKKLEKKLAAAWICLPLNELAACPLPGPPE